MTRMRRITASPHPPCRAVEASATRRVVTGSQGMPCCQASWARFVAYHFVHVEYLVRMCDARHISAGVIAIHDISYGGLPLRLIRPTGLAQQHGETNGQRNYYQVRQHGSGARYRLFNCLCASASMSSRLRIPEPLTYTE